MLQYSIYSVISPEGCASILWKTAERAPEAAEALGITAHRLKALGLVDKIVNEPVGGAHRDPKQMAAFLKRALDDALRQVERPAAASELLQRRYERLQTYGRFNDTTEPLTRGRRRRRARRRASPSAAAAIRRRCCMPPRARPRRSASTSSRCTCTTA